jgi:hypothetical protein
MRTTYMKIWTLLIILSILLMWTSTVIASLDIERVYPTLGTLGTPLDITIKGEGFDNTTRVSMALDAGNRRSVVAGIDTRTDFARDVIIDGNFAYVGFGHDPYQEYPSNEGALQVIDISNLENPQIIAEINTTLGPAFSLALHNDYLFIAGGSHQLQVVDVSDPYNPQLLTNADNTAPEKWEERYVKIHQGRAFVADAINGLYAIDINTPASPQPIANKPIRINATDFKAKSIDFKDNFAFVSCRPQGQANNGALVILDVTNPNAMQIKGSVLMPTWEVYNVTVVGDYAYVATSQSGIQVVNISDPENPAIVHTFNTSGRAFAITVAGQTGYVADNLFGITVLDLTDPTDINALGVIDTPGEAQRIVLKGDFACVADGEAGLQVVDIKAPAVQQVIAWVPTPGVAQFFERKGDYIYLGDGGGGLQVIDVSNPESPFIAGHTPTTHLARHVDVVGNIAYIADTQGGLQVADISDPTKPRIIGSLIDDLPVTQPWTRYVTVDENSDIAFLANLSRLFLVDVSDPGNPTYKSQLTGFKGLDGIIAIKGTYAYVPEKKNGGKINVVNFSDPDNPVVVNTIDVVPGETEEGPRAVSIVGNKAYVANGDHGLCILDITNPANPVFNSSWSIELFHRAFFVSVIGNTAYVADGRSGIQMVDVSDPANMWVIGALDTPVEANCLAVDDDKVLVADFGNGFIVVPLPMSITPITVQSPNIISCTLPSPLYPGHYNLRVFSPTDTGYVEDGAVTFSEDSQGLQGHHRCRRQLHHPPGAEAGRGIPAGGQ